MDLLISEPFGYMLYNERMLETYLHAKKWLKPGGKCRMYLDELIAGYIRQPLIISAVVFLNQLHAGLRPAGVWFLLSTTPVCAFVSMCVYICHEASGIIKAPYDWLNKFYSFYVAAVVGIISRCGLSIDVHH